MARRHGEAQHDFLLDQIVQIECARARHEIDVVVFPFRWVCIGGARKQDDLASSVHVEPELLQATLAPNRQIRGQTYAQGWLPLSRHTAFYGVAYCPVPTGQKILKPRHTRLQQLASNT